MDLREYIEVEEGIKCMIYGKPDSIPNDKVVLYEAYAKQFINNARQQDINSENEVKSKSPQLGSMSTDDIDITLVVKEF